MTKRIVLVPLDGSEISRQIVPELMKFINPADNELILLQVAHAPGGKVGLPSRPASAEVPLSMYESARDVEYRTHPIYASQEWDSLSAQIEDELQEVARPLREAGFTVQTVIRFGKAAEKIVDFIEENHVGLVAMTTHGRSGLSRLVLGSVAEQVLRSAPVPVLLFRAVEASSMELAGAHLPVEAVTQN